MKAENKGGHSHIKSSNQIEAQMLAAFKLGKQQTLQNDTPRHSKMPQISVHHLKIDMLKGLDFSKKSHLSIQDKSEGKARTRNQAKTHHPEKESKVLRQLKKMP